MEAQRLYRFLKQAPRDGRWLLRRVGPDFHLRLDELRAQGLPVSAEWGEIDGRVGVVYRASDQPELFSDPPPSESR